MFVQVTYRNILLYILILNYIYGCTPSSCADFTPALLFQRANRAAYSCLKSWEGSVQVSLAALELMAGLSRLQIENISKITSLLLAWGCCGQVESINFLSLSMHPSSLPPSLSFLPSLRPCRLQAGS